MATYRMTFAESAAHKPAHPERTAKRVTGWQVEYRTWNSAEAMHRFLNSQNNSWIAVRMESDA